MGPALLALGGSTAAFGAASCCALPILLAAAGLGTAWLGGIAVFAAPYRGALIATAVVCLTGAVVFLWRQRTTTSCRSGAVCTRSNIRSLAMAGVLLGLTLLYVGYSYG